MSRLPYLVLGLFTLGNIGSLFSEEPKIVSHSASASAKIAIEAEVKSNPALTELQRQKEKLALQNQLADEALHQELAAQNAELQRIKVGADLAQARSDRELEVQRAELEKTKLAIETVTSRAALETARWQAVLQSEMTELRTARERAGLEAELAAAQLTAKNSAFRQKELEWNAKRLELEAHLAEREKESEADTYADRRPVYLKDPLRPDGSLVLSDRCIPLNGAITMSTASFVSARIDYFNNKNQEWPIFLVIDDSPGGSVMAGYKILKSMQSSSAPVYVVVKSFAASMAAAITTLAERSFAYPNAIILHHQISTDLSGNLTEQREGLKTLEQWWQRLAAPIAKKMGISTEEFVKEMYAHTISGDWKEFADDAAKLKWVDVVVGRCQETAWIHNPDAGQRSAPLVASTEDDRATGNRIGESPRRASDEKTDSKGRVYRALPRLNPVDCYYLYNPDGYYRLE